MKDIKHISLDFFELSPGPGPDFPGFESGSGFYPVLIPGPVCIHRVQVRDLFIFESGSDSSFHSACTDPCPCSVPAFTNALRLFIINIGRTNGNMVINFIASFI